MSTILEIAQKMINREVMYRFVPNGIPIYGSDNNWTEPLQFWHIQCTVCHGDVERFTITIKIPSSDNVSSWTSKRNIILHTCDQCTKHIKKAYEDLQLHSQV